MPQNAELMKIKQRKRVGKAGFTRVENFIWSIEPNTIDIEEVKLRLNKLDDLWKSLEEILTELAVHDENVTDEQVDKVLVNYEKKYFDLKLAGERIIKNRVRPTLALDDLNQAALPDVPRVRNNDSNVRLPKINLPTFSGDYEEWYSFFNTFNALIHSNTSLNEIQKFHYLKFAVKGKAAETIASLEISEVHYNDAWLRLKDRYDNERIAVQEHIKAIFELPALRKENSATLRSILDGILKHTRALTALGRPTSQWDDLLVYIINSKLDFATMKEWETSIEVRQMPTFRELIDFLIRRCQMLEAVARRSPSTQPSTTSRQISKGKSTMSHAAMTSVRCMYCNGDHQIYQCKSFKELSTAERLKNVKTKKLYLNCLKGKHIAKDRLASGCKNVRKNTVLYYTRIASH
ncbi:uncharacterized protein LOC116850993 [Odontomachus brunneus]|uniref:uncharacterized protein LOC116850993 n=1 Tax=Odontomachus brunneus TaxID=486640 RepID=UPI0013F24D91|nr:uncharacterized protein LOC116850993 [Odontomachus brunneus]